MAMFIRVKRKKATFFIQCDPSETVLQIKAKVQCLTDTHVDKQRLTLVSTQSILKDAKTLAEQKVENDAIVALTLKTENGEWEDVDIQKPRHHYSTLETE
eukprot:c24010_g1_i1 orf=146-445(-)